MTGDLKPAKGLAVHLQRIGRAKRKPLEEKSLEELIDHACAIGVFDVHQFVSSDGTEWCSSIKFRTIDGISLEAKSGFQPDIRTAINTAIENAETIRNQFK